MYEISLLFFRAEKLPGNNTLINYFIFIFSNESTITPSAPNSVASCKSAGVLIPNRTTRFLLFLRKQSIAALSQVSTTGERASPSVKVSTTSTLRCNSKPYQRGCGCLSGHKCVRAGCLPAYYGWYHGFQTRGLIAEGR